MTWNIKKLRERKSIFITSEKYESVDNATFKMFFCTWLFFNQTFTRFIPDYQHFKTCLKYKNNGHTLIWKLLWT